MIGSLIQGLVLYNQMLCRLFSSDDQYNQPSYFDYLHNSSSYQIPYRYSYVGRSNLPNFTKTLPMLQDRW